jgi:hypothetical protein
MAGFLVGIEDHGHKALEGIQGQREEAPANPQLSGHIGGTHIGTASPGDVYVRDGVPDEPSKWDGAGQIGA